MGSTYTPQNVLSGFQSTDIINIELAAIATDLDDKLSRSGVAPNAMAAQLDLGDNRTINQAEGVLGTDGVNLNQVNTVATNVALTILGTGAVSQAQTTGDPITFNFGTATGSQGVNNRTEFDLNVLFAVDAFLGLTVVVNGAVQTAGLAYTVTNDTLVTFTESLDPATGILFIFGDLSPTPVFSNINAQMPETTATATAGQTVVTAPTYVIGFNQLIFMIDGIIQSLGFGDYTETSTTSITIDEAMVGGERLVIRNITGSP